MIDVGKMSILLIEKGNFAASVHAAESLRLFYVLMLAQHFKESRLPITLDDRLPRSVRNTAQHCVGFGQVGMAASGKPSSAAMSRQFLSASASSHALAVAACRNVML
jgi:hypothetical protein